MAENARNEVLNLMHRKEQIEKEIRQMNTILQQVTIKYSQKIFVQNERFCFILEWYRYERSIS